MRQPILFLSHGSPLTALSPGELGGVWRVLSRRLIEEAQRPRAIVAATAHWTTAAPRVGAASQPATVHDFSGFPEALYRLEYTPPGDPVLALKVVERLKDAGLSAEVDPARGLDHGIWVPLRRLFPEAQIPVVPLSVQPQQGAAAHLALGRALRPLRDEGVLIVATGHLTHNLADWHRRQHAALPQPDERSRAFRQRVHDGLVGHRSIPWSEWNRVLPEASFAHPTPEHFLPLLVALGAAGHGDGLAGAGASAEWLGGGWVDGALAADNYAWWD